MNKLLVIFYLLLQFTGIIVPSTNLDNTATPNNDSLCEDVTISMNEKVLSVKNLNAPHVHVDVYRIDRNNGWKNVFACNDNCGKEVNVNVSPRQEYMVHIKLFSENWEKICERQMKLNASNNQTTCDDVSVVIDADMMTVGHLTAPHQNLDIYQVEQGGGWTKVFGANDIMKRRVSVKINPKQKHIILVKMFDKQWGKTCEKEIEYQP